MKQLRELIIVMTTTITKTQINEMIKEILSEQQFLDPKVRRNGNDPQIQKALQIESKVFTEVVGKIEKAKAQVEQLLVGKTVTVTPSSGNSIIRKSFKGKITGVSVYTDQNEMSFEVIVSGGHFTLFEIS